MENNKKINEEELTSVAGGEVPVQKLLIIAPIADTLLRIRLAGQ